MFRKRAIEMLRRGLKSLNELEAVEERERLAAEASVPSPTPILEAPRDFYNLPFNPALVESLINFDSTDPF